MKQLGPVTYKIKVPGSDSPPYVAHVNRLKKYYPTTDPSRPTIEDSQKDREELLREELGHRCQYLMIMDAADKQEQERAVTESLLEIRTDK